MGIIDSLVGGIMTWAVKRDIKSDPQFRKTIAQYDSDIARLSSEIETLVRQLEGGNKQKKSKKKTPANDLNS
jgi:hypothetical protein